MRNFYKKVLLIFGVVVGVLLMVFGGNIILWNGNWFVAGLLVTFVCGLLLIDLW